MQGYRSSYRRMRMQPKCALCGRSIEERDLVSWRGRSKAHRKCALVHPKR
jgi:hypothetical protein